MKQCLLCYAHYNDAQWVCQFCGHEVKYIDGIPTLAPEQAMVGDGFRPEYFHELAKLEDGNFWFQTRNQLVEDVLSRYIPGFKTLLEIGSGTGYVLSGIARKFPDAKLTGTELFISGLPYIAARVPSAELVQMDAKNIPWVDHFDVVGAFDVLEHIKEDDLVLREIHKALRPQGLFVLTVPQHEWMWSWQDELACHVKRYTSADINEKIKNNGFIPVYQTSFVSLLLPVMWLSRKIKNKSTKADAFSELRLGRMLNWILCGIMKIEHLLIRAGLRFNLGGSLLLIARRG